MGLFREGVVLQLAIFFSLIPYLWWRLASKNFWAATSWLSCIHLHCQWDNFPFHSWFFPFYFLLFLQNTFQDRGCIKSSILLSCPRVQLSAYPPSLLFHFSGQFHWFRYSRERFLQRVLVSGVGKTKIRICVEMLLMIYCNMKTNIS